MLGIAWENSIKTAMDESQYTQQQIQKNIILFVTSVFNVLVIFPTLPVSSNTLLLLLILLSLL